MIRLTEFEKEVVKPNLIRPLILEESGDFTLYRINWVFVQINRFG